MDKTVADLAAAVAGIEDGMVLMIGGFGGAGAPIELIHALIDRFRATGSPGNLTIVNNNAGNGRIGIAAMIDAGMVAKMICSFPRSADPRAFTEKYLAGEIGLEVVPQGTLAERIRAGGAAAAVARRKYPYIVAAAGRIIPRRQSADRRGAWKPQFPIHHCYIRRQPFGMAEQRRSRNKTARSKPM